MPEDTFLEHWGRMRKQGRSLFVRKRALNGLLLGSLYMILLTALNGELTASHLQSTDFLYKALAGLVLFPSVFALTGWWLWHTNEKNYLRHGGKQ